MPGSPDNSTTWPSPSCASCQRSSSSPISCSRPTSGVSPSCVAASKRLAACAHAHDAIGMGRLGDALQRLLAQVFVVKGAAGQTMHPLAHHDAAGLGDALQPGGEVHGLAYRAFLGTGDHHQPVAMPMRTCRCPASGTRAGTRTR